MSRNSHASKRNERVATTALWVRGGVAMAADVFSGTVNMVQGIHRSIDDTTTPLNPVATPIRLTRDLVYGCVRQVGAVSFMGAKQAAAFSETWVPARTRDIPERISLGLRSALNGALGDYLERSNNELALSMCLVDDDGRDLPMTAAAMAKALPEATGRLVVLVHGLGMNDQQWRQGGRADFGDRLSADYGYTALRLRYNSGRHISDNGQSLDAVLSDLVEMYPVPIERLTIIGHSMGGLVARSACYYAQQNSQPWLDHLGDLVCLGSPHLGAPLERLGNWFNQSLTRVPYTRPLSAIGDIRSAGVKDLRYGYLLEADWRKDEDSLVHTPSRSVPGPDHVGHFLVAATLGRNEDDPRGRWLGDLLVPVESAVGHSRRPSRRFSARDQAGRVFYNMSHFALMYHGDVYAAIAEWLEPRLDKPVAASSYLSTH